MSSRSRTLRRRVTAVLVAAGVASSVAACGGSSASSQAGSSSTAGSTSGAATTQSSSSATATHSSATATHSSTSSAHSTAPSAQASSQEGLKVFTSAGCGSCHTLAAAHATGDVGPNLDDLKPSEAEVVSQVTSGGGAMPSFAGKLSKAQIEAVAKFVATAAK